MSFRKDAVIGWLKAWNEPWCHCKGQHHSSIFPSGPSFLSVSSVYSSLLYLTARVPLISTSPSPTLKPLTAMPIGQHDTSNACSVSLV